MSQKNYLAVLEEIYNNVVPHWSAFLNLLQSFNYTVYLFYKNGSNQRSILSVYGPWAQGWAKLV